VPDLPNSATAFAASPSRGFGVLLRICVRASVRIEVSKSKLAGVVGSVPLVDLCSRLVSAMGFISSAFALFRSVTTVAALRFRGDSRAELMERFSRPPAPPQTVCKAPPSRSNGFALQLQDPPRFGGLKASCNPVRQRSAAVRPTASAPT